MSASVELSYSDELHGGLGQAIADLYTHLLQDNSKRYISCQSGLDDFVRIILIDGFKSLQFSKSHQSDYLKIKARIYDWEAAQSTDLAELQLCYCPEVPINQCLEEMYQFLRLK